MADSKRKKLAREKIDSAKAYVVEEALNLVKELATAKFPESIDIAVNLGVDPRKSDQVVRGSTVLPNGTGKSVRVAVFAQGENAEKATAAGADIVGFDDLAETIKGGELNFDVVIATPDAMRVAPTRQELFIARSAVQTLKFLRCRRICRLCWLT
jgi:large subunit ribosomal protein L1